MDGLYGQRCSVCGGFRNEPEQGIEFSKEALSQMLREIYDGLNVRDDIQREAFEETGLRLGARDLHLFGMVSERSYEGSGHWLMFLFDCLKPIDALPAEIDEGQFGFFSREEIDAAAIPPSDRTLVWPVYDSHRRSFLAYRAQCGNGDAARVEEESMLAPNFLPAENGKN